MKLNKTILDIAREEDNAVIEKSFKAEWEGNDHDKVQSAIRRHFSRKEIKTLHGDYPAAIRLYSFYERVMGLPYTSSSNYAGLWVTNTEVYCEKYPGYKYEGFVLSESGIVYAILWDKEENEILMPL